MPRRIFYQLFLSYIKTTIIMNNMILSSLLTAGAGFIASKLGISASIVVPIVSALAGFLFKQSPANGAAAGAAGGGILGAAAAGMGMDSGLGSILGSVMGDGGAGVLGSLLGGGLLGGAGGGLGGLLQGMMNKKS